LSIRLIACRIDLMNKISLQKKLRCNFGVITSISIFCLNDFSTEFLLPRFVCKVCTDFKVFFFQKKSSLLVKATLINSFYEKKNVVVFGGLRRFFFILWNLQILFFTLVFFWFIVIYLTWSIVLIFNFFCITFFVKKNVW
jgi:hypothetical protein